MILYAVVSYDPVVGVKTELYGDLESANKEAAYARIVSAYRGLDSGVILQKWEFPDNAVKITEI